MAAGVLGFGFGLSATFADSRPGQEGLSTADSDACE